MINGYKCCFECGGGEPLHKHHVIPRILGGKSTVILCESCHGLVHNLNFRNHGNVIKMGLRRATKNGKKLGRPVGKVYTDADLIERHGDIVTCLKQGMSVRNTAKFTKKGGSTVQRIKKIL